MQYYKENKTTKQFIVFLFTICAVKYVIKLVL